MTTKRTSRHHAINRTDEVMTEESAKARPNIKSYSLVQKICLTAVRAPALSSVERLLPDSELCRLRGAGAGGARR